MRVTVYLLIQELPLVTSLTKLTVTVPVQLSAALTAAVLAAGTADAHVTVVDAGHVMVGTMLSLTVMVCVHVAVLPQESDAMYIRLMVYLFVHVEADV